MLQADISYMAVLVAAIAQMAIGFFWYSPAVFAKQWMKYAGKTEADMKAGGTPTVFIWMFVASLVTAYVLAHFVDYTDSTTAGAGMQTGFWMWLGFVATTHATGMLFEKRPRGLYMITVGYQLVSLMVMGAILAVWG